MEKNALSKEDVMVKDIAIIEVQKFVEKWTYEKPEEWEVEETYPQLLKAVQKGLLIFDKEYKPTFTLAFPIKSEGENFNVETITFRTRIKPNDLSNISKGLNLAKQQVEHVLRCIAYIIGESKGIINKFEKFDYKVIEQVSTVFF